MQVKNEENTYLYAEFCNNTPWFIQLKYNATDTFPVAASYWPLYVVFACHCAQNPNFSSPKSLSHSTILKSISMGFLSIKLKQCFKHKTHNLVMRYAKLC